MAWGGCIGDVLHLDAFFLELRVGTFWVHLCLGVPITQGLYVGLVEEGSGPSFPTSRTVFHRKFCFSFRSQLEKFMSGIKKKHLLDI